MTGQGRRWLRLQGPRLLHPARRPGHRSVRLRCGRCAWCPTAYRALVGRARLAEGEWVTVIGAGGVGLSAVMIARALGGRGLIERTIGLDDAAALLPGFDQARVAGITIMDPTR